MRTYCRECVKNDQQREAIEAVRKEAIEYAKTNNIEVVIILRSDTEVFYVLDGDERIKTHTKVDTLIF